MRSKQPGRGFTLLEVVVVLLIIGIISSLAVLKVDSRGERMELEARRLVRLLQLARDEAVLNGREYALRFQEGGYAFLGLQEQEWYVLAADDVFRPRQLPRETAIELFLDGQATGPAGSGAEPESEELPRVYILSSGEMTPFTITIRDQSTGSGFRVTGGAAGAIRLEPLES